jgi:phosphate butyryltransferase
VIDTARCSLSTGFLKSRQQPAFITPERTVNTFAQILESARKAGPARFVVAQAADSTILEALSEARAAGFARPVLVGVRNEIAAAAAERSLDIGGWEIVETASRTDAAAEAVKYVARGDGDILVKGLLQSADLLRAVLSKANGLTTGRTLSHVGVFRFEESDRFYFVTDAALSIAPDYSQKIDIVQNAVDLAHRLGIPQPIVAMLCAIETVNPEMPATVDAACLAKMAERGAIRGARVEGPLALDNAVNVEAARHKGITSELAGRADILVAPNIEAANILYKALIFFAKAEEAGIVMGARAPIVLASRSDSVRNKLYSMALGALAR